MPGGFSHLAFIEQLSSKPQLTPRLSPTDRSLLATPEAALGALGPDLFYFAPDDFQGGMGDFLRKYREIQEALKSFEEVIERIEEILKLPSPVDILASDVLNAVQSLIQTVQATVVAGILKEITDRIDVFEQYLTPGMYANNPVATWFWTDIVHNKKTAHFAHALLDDATTPETRAYALGYISHFTCDAVGHGWINLLSGGGYRNHWRRHALVEKWLDVQLWDQLYAQELCSSGAYAHIAFPNDQLPTDIRDLIHNALARIYPAERTPAISHGDIDACYHYFFDYLKGESSRSLLNVPPMPPFDWFTLDNYIQDMFQEMSNPPTPGAMPTGSAGPQDWLRFLEELWDFVRWCLDVALRIALLPVKALTNLAETGIRLALWLIEKLIHDAYDHTRLALALAAHIYPTRAQLGHLPELLSPSVAGLLAWSGPFDRYYPSPPIQTYHLVHPHVAGMAVEPPSAEILPATFRDYSDVLFGGAGEEAAQVFLDEPVRPCQHVGPRGTSAATAFDRAVMLLTNNQKLINLSIDSDRAFGWPEWEPLHPKLWDCLAFRLKP